MMDEYICLEYLLKMAAITKQLLGLGLERTVNYGSCDESGQPRLARLNIL